MPCFRVSSRWAFNDLVTWLHRFTDVLHRLFARDGRTLTDRAERRELSSIRMMSNLPFR